MSSVLAVFNRTKAPVALPVVQAMLDAGRHRAIDGQHVWHSGTVALAHQHFWVTPEEVGEAQPLVNDDGLAVACDARLDNRKDVIADLKLDVDPHKGLSDAALILFAYACWGPACVEHLLGDFAFVLWDPTAQHLFLARDGLGGRELYYYLADTCCVVASEIKQVLSHPAVPRRLNEGKVAEYLASVWHSQEETFFAGIQSCPPAHWLAVSAQAVDKRRYWDVDLAARIRYRSDADYAAHFRTLLTDAVRDRLRTIGPVGFSLSGGLDSTTVVALAASLLPQTAAGAVKLRSFSYVFDELSECDERAFIEPVVRRYDLEAQYLPSDQRWTLRDVENWPGSPDAVTGDAYVPLFLAILQAAHDSGCRLLFNGQFGDSLFAGGRTWAADLLRELRFGSMIGTVARCRGSLPWRRDVGMYGVWQLAPQPLKRTYRRMRAPPAQDRLLRIDPDLARRTELMARLDLSRACPAHVAADRWERYRSLVSSGWAQGISLVREFTHRYGLEVAMPLWDRRLVEFVMAVPADQLGRPQQTRWVQREAMAGLLPEQVRTRPGKTDFYPLFARGLLERERATVERLVADPQVVRRGWVRAQWLQSELAAGSKWSSGGYALWQVLSLELWLHRYWP